MREGEFMKIVKIDRANIENIMTPKVDTILDLLNDWGDDSLNKESLAFRLCDYIKSESAYYKASFSNWWERLKLSFTHSMPLSEAKLSIAYSLLCEVVSTSQVSKLCLVEAKEKCALARFQNAKMVTGFGEGYFQEPCPGKLEKLIDEALLQIS
jgi:hypothetical protein